MKQARHVMSRSVATVNPETPVSEVARMMRDRNIGDVLVIEDGVLRGIVTDRDLTIRALAGNADPRQTPVREFMSTHPVTGEPHWELGRVAEMMGRHQVRRLPIVDEGQLVGILSLGDVALHVQDEPVVADSLKEISEPQLTHQVERQLVNRRSKAGSLSSGLTLGLLAGSAVMLLFTPRPGYEMRRQLVQTDWRGMGAEARDRVRKSLANANLLATVRPQPRRRRFFLFG